MNEDQPSNDQPSNHLTGQSRVVDGVPEFTISRIVNAPRELVWRLWTEPDELARWFHPHGMTTPRPTVEADVRVGGRYTYTMVSAQTGAAFPTGGTYQQVDAPERLVFSWGDADDPDDPSQKDDTGAAVITVQLVDLGAQTEVRLHVRGIDGKPGDDDAYDGWAEALANLSQAVATDAEDGSLRQKGSQ